MEAERTGDLSELGTTIVDPFTQQPFSGNVIPPERISPIAQRILDLFPLPNRAGTSGNYLPTTVAKNDTTAVNARWTSGLPARTS